MTLVRTIIIIIDLIKMIKEMNFKREKKGMSVVIGYVMLIIIGLSLSIIVYNWIKNQLPGEEKECPKGASLSLIDYNCSGGGIRIKVENSGRFNLSGYIVRGIDKNNSKREITDKSKDDNKGRYFVDDGNLVELSPGRSFSSGELEDSTTNLEGIYKLEIVPLKDGVQCSDSKLISTVDCP